MRKIFVYILSILILGITVSCTNELLLNESSKNQVKVSISTPRAIGPDFATLEWTVSAQKGRESEVNAIANGNYWLFTNLTSGTYTISVKGVYNGNTCYEGSSSVDVTGNSEINVIIPLTKTTSGGTGSMELTFEIPDEISLLIKDGETLTLMYGGQTSVEKTYTSGNKTITFTVTELAQGFYDVYLSYKYNDLYDYRCVPYDSRVSIISNCITKITYTKNDYELVDGKIIYYVNNNENGSNSSGQKINDPIDIDYLLTNSTIDSTYELILLSDVTLDSIINANSFTIDSFGTTKTITGAFNSSSLSEVKIKNLNLDGVLNLDNVDFLGNVGLNHKQYSTTTSDTFNVYKTANVVLGTNYAPSLKTFISVQGNWKIGDKIFDTSKLTVEQTKDIMRRIGLNSDHSDGYIIDNEGKYLEDTGDCPVLVWNSTESGLTSFDSVKNDGLVLNNPGIQAEDPIAFNGTDVYYINDGSIYKMGEDSPFITDEEGYSITTPIYADSNNLYYVINDTNYNLKAYSFVDGQKVGVIPLGSDSLSYEAIAVDDSYIYVATQASNQGESFIVLRKISIASTSLECSQNYGKFSSSEDSVSVTGMYIDGNELCVLFQNYRSFNSDYPYSRGGVFKFNTSDLSSVDVWNNDNNKTRYRDSIAVSKDCYKTAFLLPTKIVGIYKRKLIIIDDGVSCIDDEDIYGNVDRVVLFDLDGATFDYNFSVNSFTINFNKTQGSSFQNTISHPFYSGSFIF